MKITQKATPNSGPTNKHTKSSKKSKGTKKSPDKTLRDANSTDSQQVLPKQNAPDQPPRKTTDSEFPDKVPETRSARKPKLEKRKQDGAEWKPLKKVDYQRLETVMEEGQLSGGEAPSRHNFFDTGKSDSGSDFDHPVTDVAPIKSRNSWIYSLMSLAEHPRVHKRKEPPPKRTPKSDRLQRKQHPPSSKHHQPDPLKKLNTEKANMIEIGEPHGEPSEALPNKRNVILSGMMEILPIFSNENFACSRDAINIKEYEGMDLDRSGTCPGNTFLESKNGRDSRRSLDIKPFFSGNCVRKEGSLEGGYKEGLGDFKEVAERKLRYRVFTDRNVCQKTSSPFINSLLVLTPFSSERERMLSEEKVKVNPDDSRLSATSDFAADLQADGKHRLWKICFGVTMTTICLLTTMLTVAWKSYKPPCFVDSVMEVLPFVHRRRSYFQRAFDKFYKLFSNLLGALNVRLSYSGRLSDISAF